MLPAASQLEPSRPGGPPPSRGLKMLAADLSLLQGAHLDCHPLPGHGCRPGARPHPPSSPASTCWALSCAQARPGREGPALAGLRSGSRTDGEAPRPGHGLAGRGSGALTRSWPSPGTRAQGPIPGGPTERGEGSWGDSQVQNEGARVDSAGPGGRQGRAWPGARPRGGRGPRGTAEGRRARARGEGAEGRQEPAEAASLRRSPRAAPQTDRARPRRRWRQRQQQAAAPAPGRRRAGAGSGRRSPAAPRRRLRPAAWTNTSAS